MNQTITKGFPKDPKKSGVCSIINSRFKVAEESGYVKKNINLDLVLNTFKQLYIEFSPDPYQVSDFKNGIF